MANGEYAAGSGGGEELLLDTLKVSRGACRRMKMELCENSGPSYKGDQTPVGQSPEAWGELRGEAWDE